MEANQNSITQFVYDRMTSDGSDALGAGIDLVYSPLDNCFFVMSDSGAYYKIEISHVPQSKFIDFKRKKKQSQK